MYLKNGRKVISNIFGWRTSQKIIVIESDDWGAIRVPNIEIFDSLVKNGFDIKDDPYCKYDGLERTIDLERLFEVLTTHKSSNGMLPKFTALCLTANPDFELIRDDDYRHYYYEPVGRTFQNRVGSEKVLDYWQEGVRSDIFIPQFHGREHLNIQKWLRDLQAGNEHSLFAFEQGVWGVYSPKINYEYQAAFDVDIPEDIQLQHSIIKTGIQLFKEQLGYSPRFFVPTNGPFNLKLLPTLKDCGIDYLLLDKFQKEPLGNNKFKTHFRVLGQQNSKGQIFLSRNVVFEPAQFPGSQVDQCLSDIDLMFRLKKPAIISTHRVNYIGVKDENNSSNSLKQLSELLGRIIQKWPDVVFMTSVELGDLIRNEKR